MSIEFDQVEGVVQRDAEPQSQPAQAAPPRPQRPLAEQLEEAHRRMEWSMRRLHAD